MVLVLDVTMQSSQKLLRINNAAVGSRNGNFYAFYKIGENTKQQICKYSGYY